MFYALSRMSVLWVLTLLSYDTAGNEEHTAKIYGK
jgi:hypothetical protein